MRETSFFLLLKNFKDTLVLKGNKTTRRKNKGTKGLNFLCSLSLEGFFRGFCVFYFRGQRDREVGGGDGACVFCLVFDDEGHFLFLSVLLSVCVSKKKKNKGRRWF